MKFASVEQAIRFSFNMSERAEYSRNDWESSSATLIGLIESLDIVEMN